MRHRVLIVTSAAFMIVGLAILSSSFRDLPMDERPEWMVLEMVIWPVVALGLIEVGRLWRLVRHGVKLHADRGRLLVHGIPALLIAVIPAGSFTIWFGAGSFWSLLDFPTAKVMAALWLAVTFWSSWEVPAS